MTTISVADIFAQAPLGALISFSDGTPQPPARFNKKLSAWKNSNGVGTLVQVCPDLGTFTLHMGDLGSQNVIVMRVLRSFGAMSSLNFRIERAPQAGDVLCARSFRGRLEVDKVTDQAGAAVWLRNNPNGELHIVGDDGSLSPLKLAA